MQRLDNGVWIVELNTDRSNEAIVASFHAPQEIRHWVDALNKKGFVRP